MAFKRNPDPYTTLPTHSRCVQSCTVILKASAQIAGGTRIDKIGTKNLYEADVFKEVVSKFFEITNSGCKLLGQMVPF